MKICSYQCSVWKTSYNLFEKKDYFEEKNSCSEKKKTLTKKRRWEFFFFSYFVYFNKKKERKRDQKGNLIEKKRTKQGDDKTRWRGEGRLGKKRINFHFGFLFFLFVLFAIVDLPSLRQKDDKPWQLHPIDELEKTWEKERKKKQKKKNNNKTEVGTLFPCFFPFSFFFYWFLDLLFALFFLFFVCPLSPILFLPWSEKEGCDKSLISQINNVRSAMPANKWPDSGSEENDTDWTTVSS